MILLKLLLFFLFNFIICESKHTYSRVSSLEDKYKISIYYLVIIRISLPSVTSLCLLSLILLIYISFFFLGQFTCCLFKEQIHWILLHIAILIPISLISVLIFITSYHWLPLVSFDHFIRYWGSSLSAYLRSPWIWSFTSGVTVFKCSHSKAINFLLIVT